MKKIAPCRWDTDLHLYMQNGEKILLDVNSGSVHFVDEVAWDLLQELRKNHGDTRAACLVLQHRYDSFDLHDAVGELQNLQDEGFLLTEDLLNGEYGIPADTSLKALCLNLAHDCNLRCRYCFASQGTFEGERGLMNAETGKRALDFLLEHSGDHCSLQVDFFGGEPLLNGTVMMELVTYGEQQSRRVGKEIFFTLTTNALLLDRETGQFLNDHNVQVVMSLDGRRQVHDAMRFGVNGRGSYETVLLRICDFLSTRHENYIIRGTYTAQNLDFSEDFIHLADLGFHWISLEPVVADPAEDYALTPDHLPVLLEQYDRLAQNYLARRLQGDEVRFFHFEIDLEGGPCLPKRMTGCGAGFEYLAVSPGGALYPCHQFVGQEQFYLGNVFQGIVQSGIRIQEQFQLAHIYSKPNCRDCWARFYCGGGCHASNYQFGKDLKTPYQLGCELQKKRTECAIYVQALLQRASQRSLP